MDGGKMHAFTGSQNHTRKDTGDFKTEKESGAHAHPQAQAQAYTPFQLHFHVHPFICFCSRPNSGLLDGLGWFGHVVCSLPHPSSFS